MGEVDFDPCAQHDPKFSKDQQFTFHCEDCLDNALKEHKCEDYYIPDTKDCELCWLAEK